MKNKLYCGDNLEILSTLEKESVDLIYIDPPFFSNRNYAIVWGDEAEIRSFEDMWEGGMNVYIDWMKQRIIELHRVLKPTGSFYLHCDWHAGHYLKVMCDEVFGYNNFRNEIVWHYPSMSRTNKDFPRKHDDIFRYCKSKDFIFNADEVRVPYAKSTISRSKYGGAGFDSEKSQPNYLNKEGKIVDTVWEIPHIKGNEKMGYPTQKPEKLLKRIIEASSNGGDIVLDAFCGCGTALAVAEKLNRKWIGIDISPSAISLIKKRLDAIPGFVSTTGYDVIGMPQKEEDLKGFKPYEFQYWVINEMQGMPSTRKSGDMGIDGLSFFEHCPIQVKQSESIGRNVIDNFETALRRYYQSSPRLMKGYIVAFSFGKGAKEEVARAKKDNIDIHLITVKDILDKTFSPTRSRK